MDCYWFEKEYFSNSIIIQQSKTKEIMHRDVFGYLIKNSSFLHPIFPLENQFVWEVTPDTRHSVSFAISKISKFVKNTPLRVVFSTLFSVFWYVMKHCVSCLMYYIIQEEVFHPISKHRSRELGCKNEAQPIFLNELWGVWKSDKTLFQEFWYNIATTPWQVLFRQRCGFLHTH